MQTYMQTLAPPDEDERLHALYRYNILDTPVEPAFERITSLASKFFDIPIALTTLIDRDRQWFKSCHGLNIRSTSRQVSFCTHAILSDNVMVVPNAQKDERFADNPLVTGYPGIRFYAGAPLKTPEGHKLGTLCIIDTMPRAPLSAKEEETLADLAALVVDELELRDALNEARRETKKRQEGEALLQETNLKLEMATRAKSIFLANTSHELRTPISAIIGFSELLSKEVVGSLNQRQSDYTRYIYDSGNHLLALVNDTLDLSKIEAGKMELHLNEVHIPDLVRSAAPIIQERYRDGGVELKIELPQEMNPVFADERRLRQVLYNLLANAIRFTPSGGVVRIVVKDDPSRVCFAIEDMGVGIDAKDQIKLFQPFSQLDAAKGRGEGTGLGLAVTKHLVELHNGRIEVESQVGKGSTFRFSIPRR